MDIQEGGFWNRRKSDALSTCQGRHKPKARKAITKERRAVQKACKDKVEIIKANNNIKQAGLRKQKTQLPMELNFPLSALSMTGWVQVSQQNKEQLHTMQIFSQVLELFHQTEGSYNNM